MSKIALSGSPTGTGVFTIESPSSNTSRTLTLPDEAGTVLTSVSGLPAGNITGSVPTSAMPAGSVLQVVQNLNRGYSGSSKSTLLATTSNTFANILTASITTVSTNSKILIITGTASYNGVAQRGSTRVLRGATEIDSNHYSAYDTAGIFTQYQHNVLDAPSVSAGTTITYSFQGRSYNGGLVNFGYGDGGGGPATFLTLMEVAA